MTKDTIEPSRAEVEAAIDAFALVHNDCGLSMQRPNGMNESGLQVVIWTAISDALEAAEKVRAQQERGDESRV